MEQFDMFYVLNVDRRLLTLARTMTQLAKAIYPILLDRESGRLYYNELLELSYQFTPEAKALLQQFENDKEKSLGDVKEFILSKYHGKKSGKIFLKQYFLNN